MAKRIQLVDVAEALANGTDADITEASLGRILQHHKKAGLKSFSILTSLRNDATHRGNKHNFEALQHHVRSLGHGYTRMSGYWRDPRTKETSREPSLFVHGIGLDSAKRLGNKYDQHSILYAGPETEGHVHAVELETGKHSSLGAFKPLKVAACYSRIRGARPSCSYCGTKPAHASFDKNCRSCGATLPRKKNFVFEYVPINSGEARHMEIFEQVYRLSGKDIRRNDL